MLCTCISCLRQILVGRPSHAELGQPVLLGLGYPFWLVTEGRWRAGAGAGAAKRPRAGAGAGEAEGHQRASAGAGAAEGWRRSGTGAAEGRRDVV